MFLNHLRNPFINLQTSDANFSKLAGTHLERLKANNTGNRFEALILQTEPLYQAYINTLTAGSGSSSSKESKTVSTNDAIANVKAYISRKEGVIADKFPKKTSVYQEFFPLGLSEYRLASNKNLQLLTERFIKAAQIHSAVLGKDIAKEAQVLLDTYASSRTQQLQAIGSVKGISGESKARRKALALQLYKNLLQMLLANIDQTENVKTYFDTSFLKKARREEKIMAA
jgi:hypothetical protein